MKKAKKVESGTFPLEATSIDVQKNYLEINANRSGNWDVSTGSDRH